SHRELLDCLAAEFMSPVSPALRGVESGVKGWDVKHLCRLIVTSSTYQQSSKATPALLERDPKNRLLARGPRFRMPSWMLRDQALAASGLLVTKAGGPPVRPYQPAGVWEEATFGTKQYQQDHGESLYRRSLYTFWRRIVGPTEFFDSASRQTCGVRPSRTNTPLHAFTTMNDPTFVEAARVLAQRVMTTAGESDRDRIELAYRLVLARRPSEQERTILLAAVRRVRAEYVNHKEAAKELLAVGESKRDEKLDAIDHAAYTAVCLE